MAKKKKVTESEPAKEPKPVDPMKVGLPPPKQEQRGALAEIWQNLPPKKRTEYVLIAAGCL